MNSNDSDAQAVVRGNNAFALDLYRRLKETEGNLFFSPYSISTALAMTYAGARGKTEVQMARVLHIALDQERLHPAVATLDSMIADVEGRGGVQLSVANALWPQLGYALLEEYLALMKAYYGAHVTPIDYADPESARQTINDWVEAKTAGKIRDLIQPGALETLTRLVLTNAIYFKGIWEHKFDEILTGNAPFWVTPTETVSAPMMTQTREFGYAKRDQWQILELPYCDKALSLIILLPESVDGIAELEDALTAETLMAWTAKLKSRDVKVFLPRFKMDHQIELSDTLSSMGMADAFDEDKADFSGIDGRAPWLYISAVLHKAFVDVNEEGTEAAAATAVVMKKRGIRRTPLPIFRADHPFIFLIRENSTQSILFLGRVTNPVMEH